MNKDHFVEWLQAQKGFDLKSSRDVMSRLNRATKFVNLSNKTDIEMLIFKLSSNAEFKMLNPCVKSQLKRALRLADEFGR